LEIHFTGLDLSSPEKLRFRYRLDGFDSDWQVDTEGSRVAKYGALKYGSHTFHVQAGNADQTWFGNEASFAFVIPTPLWRTPWALALYGIAGFLLALGIARVVSARRYRRRLATLAAQQAMERERMRIARDMHDEIGSKLTKISYMSERAKRELQSGDSVAQKLDSIAGTSRDLLQTLDEIVWAVNPRNDTIASLASYFGSYAQRLLDLAGVACGLDIAEELPEHPLDPKFRQELFFSFKEALTNIVRHAHATQVWLRIAVRGRRLEVEVSDNGRGFNQSEPRAGSDGLANMKERLKNLGGVCEIVSDAKNGTSVRFSAPLPERLL
jgi:signal transduction histidine kinase